MQKKQKKREVIPATKLQRLMAGERKQVPYCDGGVLLAECGRLGYGVSTCKSLRHDHALIASITPGLGCSWELQED